MYRAVVCALLSGVSYEAASASPDRDLSPDEVIVTSTKRDTPLQDVPASVEVLSGRKLEEAGATEMRDYLRQVPGVSLNELQPDLQRISIRGIDADVGTITTQTSGVFIDEVPFNDPFFSQVRPDLAPFDLEAVEILKGPQGTLFGGSGLAGAIRYRLADAELGSWQFRAFGQSQGVADNSSNRIGGAMVNLPIGGNDAALRLVGVRRLSGGVIDDLNTGESDTDSSASYSARAMLRWDPSPQLSLHLKALTQQTKAADRPYSEYADGRLEREQTIGESPLLNEFDLYGLDIHYRMPWATLVSTTSSVSKYSDAKNAGGERSLGTAPLAANFPLTADVDGLVQEFRLVSPDAADSRWQWLAGVFLNDYDGVTSQQVNLEAAPGLFAELGSINIDVSASELAVFGELARHLGERWTLTLGLRGYRLETEGTVVGSGPAFSPNGLPATLSDAGTDASGVNPKFAVQFDISRNASTYASVARGFRFGGIQLTGPSTQNPNVPATYKPDSIWSYELGFRTQWLQRRLQADGAVFYIDWNDPQVRTVSQGATPVNVIDNVGGARSYGAELALRYLLPVPGLDAALSAGYTDAQTTSDFTDANGSLVRSGARLPGYADVQVAGTLRYQWWWGSNRLAAALSHVYLGDGVSDIQQSKKILDYQTTDIRVSIGSDKLMGHPQLSLGVTNLDDERGLVSAYVTTPDNFYAVYNRPRSFDVRLDLSF